MKSLALLPIFLLAGCAHRQPEIRTVDTSCITLAPISFAQLGLGKVDDPGNKADSDATVAEIMAHNVKWEALCGVPAKAATAP